MERGFVSDQMRSGRIVSHGKITDLTNGFKFKNEVPFSLLILPKINVTSGVISAPTNIGLVVSCKMFQDDEFSDYPVYFNNETVAAIREIAPGAINTEEYDIYWGSGSKAELMEELVD
jgi:hypothetical protein